MDRELILQRAKELTALLRKYRYLLLVIGCGVLLLLLPRTESRKPDAAQETRIEIADDTFSLAAEEQRLAEALEHIRGVGRVRVVLSLKTTMETVYQEDLRTDASKDETSERREDVTDTVIVSAGSGAQQALARKQVYPTYQGALIVCDGGESPEIRLQVTSAVTALTGLAANRITVLRYE